MPQFKLDPSNPNTYARLCKEGRGQGERENYKPWLTVRDLSSRGLSCRVPGWRDCHRAVNLFSKLERDFFHRLEWDPTVTDIREQYPLKLAETVAIAAENNWYHPLGQKTGLPMPMTTDFLVTYRGADETTMCAYSIKPKQEIELAGATRPIRVKNNLAKLMLEREYWRQQGVKHLLVTEADFSRVLATNVRAVRSYYDLKSIPALVPQDVERVHAWLYPRVLNGGGSLSHLALACDRHFGFSLGTSLKVVRHLIASWRWQVDFTVPFDVNKPLKFKHHE